MATSDTTGRLIVVAGMHRSGTSAVTRALNLLGAHIPEPLVPAFKGNELGHWEPEAVVHMNDRFLSQAGSHVNTALPIAPGWFGSASARRASDEIARWLEPRLAAHPLVVVKDPRIALLARVWRNAIESVGVTPRFVMPFRHPQEVAASLSRRQLHFFPDEVWPPARGLSIWLTHVVELERATRGTLRSIVPFDAFLSDWRPALERSLTQLELPAEIGADAAAAVAASIRSDARREVADRTALPPADVRRVLEALEGAVEDPQSGGAVFDRVAAKLMETNALLGPYLAALEAASATTNASAASASQLKLQRDEALTRAAALERRLASARQVGVQRDAEAARLIRIERSVEDVSAGLDAAHALDEAQGQIRRLSARAEALAAAHLTQNDQTRSALDAAAVRRSEDEVRIAVLEAKAQAADTLEAELLAVRRRLTEAEGLLTHARTYAARLAQDVVQTARHDAVAACAHSDAVTLAKNAEGLAARQALASATVLGELELEVQARRQAQAHARNLEACVIAMRASRSWRLTAPLRRLRRR